MRQTDTQMEKQINEERNSKRQSKREELKEDRGCEMLQMLMLYKSQNIFCDHQTARNRGEEL